MNNNTEPMKTILIFEAYCYHTLRGWIRMPNQPQNGFDTLETATDFIKSSSQKYPGHSYTVLSIIKTIPNE